MMSEEEKEEMRKIVSDAINEKLVAVGLGMLCAGLVLFVLYVSAW
jgi:hypothetical protein